MNLLRQKYIGKYLDEGFDFGACLSSLVKTCKNLFYRTALHRNENADKSVRRKLLTGAIAVSQLYSEFRQVFIPPFC